MEKWTWKAEMMNNCINSIHLYYYIDQLYGYKKWLTQLDRLHLTADWKCEHNCNNWAHTQWSVTPLTKKLTFLLMSYPLLVFLLAVTTAFYYQVHFKLNFHQKWSDFVNSKGRVWKKYFWFTEMIVLALFQVIMTI